MITKISEEKWMTSEEVATLSRAASLLGVTPVINRGTMRTTAHREGFPEIKKLLDTGVVESCEDPAHCSPLAVVQSGDEGLLRSRNMQTVVAAMQRDRGGQLRTARLNEDASATGLGAVLKDRDGHVLSKLAKDGSNGFEDQSSTNRELQAVEMAAEVGVRSWERLDSMCFSTHHEQLDWDWLGGAKRISFEEVVGRAGPKLHPLVADLAKSMRSCKAVSTAKAYEAASKGRRDWCKAQGLVDDEISFILFLADRAKSVGSSAIGVEKAAFHFSNGPLSHYIGNFAGEMMEAKRRAEIANRSDTTVVLRGDIENVWELWNPSIEARLERDILIVVLSFEALLRASEAAELLWSDLEQAGPLLRVSIRKAKNDQMALGRTTFVECREGSKLHLLVNRWKARVSNTSQFVFANLANGKQLTPSAVASSAKKLLTKVGRGDSSHHSLRRGRANELLSKGMSRDQVQQRGRWRSFAGLARYIKDTPGAQGIVEM